MPNRYITHETGCQYRCRDDGDAEGQRVYAERLGVRQTYFLPRPAPPPPVVDELLVPIIFVAACFILICMAVLA